MSKRFARFVNDESGVEYGLIAAAISLAIIVVVIGSYLSTKFGAIN